MHPQAAGLALEWMAPMLQRGAKVAEVDCGSGALTMVLALAFPGSRFFGFDRDAAAITIARQRAEAAGVAGHTWFEPAAAGDFPGTGYQLVVQLVAGQAGAGALQVVARHVRRTLAPDGCWVVLEPGSGDPDVDGRSGRLRRVVFEGGFTRVRCAPAMLAGLIVQARP
jgi:ribosomal protein L11 methylase PrmA